MTLTAEPEPADRPTAPGMIVDISMHDDRWREMDIDLHTLSQQAADLAVSGHDVTGAEIAIAFGSDEWIKQLNKKFCGIDNATNVLAFPGQSDTPHLGDIALARETIITEATTENKAVTAHLSHLIIHACLHLLGYDHIETDDAAEMEALEIELLATIGIANPYREIDPLAASPEHQNYP
jgi:probable rRNA maturation factor